MPKIDFHVLADPASDAHLRFVCRLAEQAVDEGHRVFIRTWSGEESKRLDDLLWTFGDRSFLPHEIATDTSPRHERVRILIGDAAAADPFRDVLVNMGSAAPPDLDSLQRIIEIVPTDPARKRQARERFKHYREQGIEPESHNV